VKFTIEGFSQPVLVGLGLNLADALILRWFVDFSQSGDMKMLIVDGRPFYWVHYQAVIDDLPCLEITNKESLARRFRKLVDAGVLDLHIHTVGGKYAYFAVNSVGFGPLVRDKPIDAGVDSPVDAKVDSCRRSSRDPIDAKVGSNDSSTNDPSTRSRKASPKKPGLKTFGEFGRVELTDDEEAALVKRVGRPCFGRMVEILDTYLQEWEEGHPGRSRYKSHYAAMIRWVAEKALKEPTLWKDDKKYTLSEVVKPTDQETAAVLEDLESLLRGPRRKQLDNL
jgi:hypothetical protein